MSPNWAGRSFLIQKGKGTVITSSVVITNGSSGTLDAEPVTVDVMSAQMPEGAVAASGFAGAVKPRRL